MRSPSAGITIGVGIGIENECWQELSEILTPTPIESGVGIEWRLNKVSKRDPERVQQQSPGREPWELGNGTEPALLRQQIGVVWYKSSYINNMHKDGQINKKCLFPILWEAPQVSLLLKGRRSLLRPFRAIL
jgi:hypothetical protein